jgi:hypothetical protein
MRAFRTRKPAGHQFRETRAGRGIGNWGQCANLDTSCFSLCCLDCAIDESSQSRRHLPVPSVDHSASQLLTHISGTAHLQFLRQPLLRDSGPAPQKLGQADFSRITPPAPYVKICTLTPILIWSNAQRAAVAKEVCLSLSRWASISLLRPA